MLTRKQEIPVEDNIDYTRKRVNEFNNAMDVDKNQLSSISDVKDQEESAKAQQLATKHLTSSLTTSTYKDTSNTLRVAAQERTRRWKETSKKHLDSLLKCINKEKACYYWPKADH